MTRALRHDGFTLLEVMVAVGLTAFLVVAMVEVYRNIVDVQMRLSEGRDGRAADRLFDRLESELLGTMIVALEGDDDRLGHPWLFVGEDNLFQTNDSDGMRFVTRSPARATGASTGAGLAMVSYAAVAVDTDQVEIWRSEEALPPGMDKRIEMIDGAPVMDEIWSFRLRFLDDPNGGSGWLERWDSTGVERTDRLPAAVELTLELAEHDEVTGELGPGPTHTRVVRLPLRPFVESELRRGTLEDKTTCLTGMTVWECVDLFATELSRVDNETRALVLAQRYRTGDPCWTVAEPSARWQKLYDLLVDRIGVNPNGVCK